MHPELLKRLSILSIWLTDQSEFISRTLKHELPNGVSHVLQRALQQKQELQEEIRKQLRTSKYDEVHEPSATEAPYLSGVTNDDDDLYDMLSELKVHEKFVLDEVLSAAQVAEIHESEFKTSLLAYATDISRFLHEFDKLVSEVRGHSEDLA